jgi:histidinol-phosphate/aromatic aminotransferase/cobyric acid decarboxylase-like protein
MVSFGENGNRIFRELAKRNILIRERPDCGLGCARITIGTSKEMDQVLKVIAKAKRKG